MIISNNMLPFAPGTERVYDMFQNPLLTPVVTPRGIARCSKTLLTQLGEMAKAHDIPVQASVIVY